MDWVSKVARGANGRLQLKVVTKRGTTARDVTQLRPMLDLYAPVHRNLRLELTTLRRCASRSFLDAVGHGQPMSHTQSVYEAEVDGAHVCIPAQLLVMACFGSHAPLREQLLRPNGLQQLSDDMRRQTTSEVLARKLHWLAGSPSAIAAWASVYRHALDGRFDMEMPRAVAELSTWGRTTGDAFHVARAQLVAVTPTEPSLHGEESGVRQSFDQASGKRTEAWPHQMQFDARVLELVPERRLSDWQWAVVRPLLAEAMGYDRPGRPGPQPKYGLRGLIDAMLYKLAAPCRWSDVPGNPLLVAKARALMRVLRSRGTLEAVFAVLAECPSAEVSPQPGRV